MAEGAGPTDTREEGERAAARAHDRGRSAEKALKEGAAAREESGEARGRERRQADMAISSRGRKRPCDNQGS